MPRRLPPRLPPLDVARLRRQFPALARRVGGQRAIYADAPGGTQAPRAVLAALTDYLARANANAGGRFATSHETAGTISQARADAAALLGSSAEEIVFGPNMTSLTFSVSRAIARTWHPGDEVVVTALDHDANVAPWLAAAGDRGATVRVIPFDERCMVAPEALRAALSERTRLVALPWASNAVGSIVDLAGLVAAAHRVGALAYVDAVHYAPHGPIDVRALDCDFLACSAYKFGGPHLGILYGKAELLRSLTPYKVRPSSEAIPARWETGTQSFEGMAGLSACVRYLGGLGGRSPSADRAALLRAYARIQEHERALSRRFLAGCAALGGVRIYGLSDPNEAHLRTPTFGLRLAACTPRQACERLAKRGIFCWDGHFYAKGLVEQLGLAEDGGLLRIGFAHYATTQEIDRVLAELARLAR